MRYGKMVKFLNDNGIMVMQAVIANEVDAQLFTGIEDDLFEEICDKIFMTYIDSVFDDEPCIKNLVADELKSRGLYD